MSQRFQIVGGMGQTIWKTATYEKEKCLMDKVDNPRKWCWKQNFTINITIYSGCYKFKLITALQHPVWSGTMVVSNTQCDPVKK